MWGKIIKLKLHSFIIVFGSGIITIAFFVALFFSKKEKPLYYKYIFHFIILGGLLSINSIVNANIFWGFSREIPFLLQELLLLLQYVLLGLFFAKLLSSSIYSKKIIRLLFFSIPLLLSFQIIFFFKTTDIRPSFILTFFLLVFCYFYVKDLMTNKPTLILLKSSAFWIVMGVFFYSCVSFPIKTLIIFIPKSQEYINLRSQIFSVLNMSLIVLYLFIIKSYSCLKHPQNL